MTAVMCDKGESARMKVKVLETVAGAAMCGLRTVSLRIRREAGLEAADMKMLSFCFGWAGRAMRTSEGHGASISDALAITSDGPA